MSFAMEDDIREVGKKVAAYAHLLALILQNKAFYNACVGSLKEHLPSLLEFVKLSPNSFLRIISLDRPRSSHR